MSASHSKTLWSLEFENMLNENLLFKENNKMKLKKTLQLYKHVISVLLFGQKLNSRVRIVICSYLRKSHLKKELSSCTIGFFFKCIWDRLKYHEEEADNFGWPDPKSVKLKPCKNKKVTIILLYNIHFRLNSKYQAVKTAWQKIYDFIRWLDQPSTWWERTHSALQFWPWAMTNRPKKLFRFDYKYSILSKNALFFFLQLRTSSLLKK